MQYAPKPPNPDQPITVAFGRTLVKIIKQSQVKPSVGQRISRSGFGTTINAATESPRTNVFADEEAVKPWTIRWFPWSEEDDTLGEWQIFVPTGSAILNADDLYMAKNDNAKDADGEIIGDWYAIADVDDDHATSDESEYEGVARRVEKWTIYAHLKPWPRVLASADTDGFGKTMQSDVVGTICRVTYTYDSGEGERTVTEHFVNQQIMDDVVKLERDTTGTFAIVYETEEGKEIEKDAAWKPYVTNQRMMLGRVQATKTENTCVNEWQTVVVRVDHPAEDFTLSVVQTEAQSDDDKTCVTIYELEDDVVTQDNRSQLSKIPFYN